MKKILEPEKRMYLAGLILLILVVLIGGVMAAGPSTQIQTFAALDAGERAELEAIRNDAESIISRVDGLLQVTTTAPPTTGTTRPTTTTRPPTTTTGATTTTVAPTTTTVPPPTTTTTQPFPTPTGAKFTVLLVGGTDPETRFWWNAPYFRTLPSGAGWLDGDRSGYRCLYAFLEHDGQIVGRVEFIRIPGAEYAVVNDSGMQEGVRFFDGTLAGPNEPRELGECPQTNIEYEPYTGPDQRPVVDYLTVDGQLLERRSYPTVVPGGPYIKFQQIESSPTRVGVVAYFFNNPALVVYYTSLDPNVVMDSDLG